MSQLITIKCMTEIIENEDESLIGQDGVVEDSAQMSDEDKVAVRSYAERCCLAMNESDALTPDISPDVARNMLLLREIESVVTDLNDKMMKFFRIMYPEIFAQYALHNYLVFEKTLLFANDSRLEFTTIDNKRKEPADTEFKIDWSGLGIHIMVANNYRGLCGWWLSVVEKNIDRDQFGRINFYSSHELDIDPNQYAKRKLKSGGALDVFLDLIVKVRDEFIAHIDILLRHQEKLMTEISSKIDSVLLASKRTYASLSGREYDRDSDIDGFYFGGGDLYYRQLESDRGFFRRRILGLKNILASK